jgi:predicted component of type VI protein secretion system
VEAKLVVVDGDAKVRQYELQLPTVIGRSRSTDVRLGHPLVSRQHCEVFEVEGLLMVRDLGSLNGTFVGDTRIAGEAIPVEPGDSFTVGPVTFRAEYLMNGPGPDRLPTWEAPVAAHEDPVSSGNGHAQEDLGKTPDAPLFSDDEDTVQPDE